MADNGRWFKVWTSILSDTEIRELDLDDLGRWVVLGALTKSGGEAGVLRVNGSARLLCELLRVPDLPAAKAALARLPGLVVSDEPIRRLHGSGKPALVHGSAFRGREAIGQGSETFEEWCRRYGSFVVTFLNWRKYQDDPTVAARMRALRSKKRGEENKKETPSDTREVITHPETSDPPEGSEGLSSLWEGPDRKPLGSVRMDGVGDDPVGLPRNGRTRYPVEDLVGSVASRRALAR